MSFSFGTPKTDGTPTFGIGNASGDAKAQAKPQTPTATAQPTNMFGAKPVTPFSLGGGQTFATPGAPGSFSFNTPPPAAAAPPATSAFALGTAPTGFGVAGTTPTGFGAATTPAPSFGVPAPTSATTGFNLSSTAATSAPGGFSLGGAAPPATAAPAPGAGGFTLSSGPAKTTPLVASFNLPTATTTTASGGFSLGGGTTAVSTATPAAATPSLGLPLGGTPTKTTAALSFGTTTAASTIPSFSLGGASTTTALAASTATTTSAIPTTGALTFAQLEETINKWTIDLDEQGKLFANQAKQLNAWDRLLISNGDKVLDLHNGITRVKQQQQQLDQELDFVRAQQKELEDLILPLEKELENLPATDLDRSQTYLMAENIDTQLKQMTEDLKEVIEQLNETNRAQELSNPITQISKILNVHMNSLQWIDRNTTKITSHLDQITKLHTIARKNHENSLQYD